MLSSWIQFVSASQFREFMQFMWFVLEKRTPYEACVEPYQHVTQRGATSSRASTRVYRAPSPAARRQSARHRATVTSRASPAARHQPRVTVASQRATRELDHRDHRDHRNHRKHVIMLGIVHWNHALLDESPNRTEPHRTAPNRAEDVRPTATICSPAASHCCVAFRPSAHERKFV